MSHSNLIQITDSASEQCYNDNINTQQGQDNMNLQQLNQQYEELGAERQEWSDLFQAEENYDVKMSIYDELQTLSERLDELNDMIFDAEITQNYREFKESVTDTLSVIVDTVIAETPEEYLEVESVEVQDEEEMLVDTLIEEGYDFDQVDDNTEVEVYSSPQGHLDWVESIENYLEEQSYRELQAELKDRPDCTVRRNSNANILRTELARLLRQEQVNYLLHLCNQDTTRYDAVLELFDGNVSKGIKSLELAQEPEVVNSKFTESLESFNRWFSSFLEYLTWLVGYRRYHTV